MMLFTPYALDQGHVVLKTQHLLPPPATLATQRYAMGYENKSFLPFVLIISLDNTELLFWKH